MKKEFAQHHTFLKHSANPGSPQRRLQSHRLSIQILFALLDMKQYKYQKIIRR